TLGSVDDGKSTLLARLLFDSGNLAKDILAAVEEQGEINFSKLAYLIDGLKEEREQGITIDVAYRYFNTEKRRYIVADAPGHEQYTANAVTAASSAQIAVLLLDVEKGLTTQSKRHLFVTSLMRVPHLIVVVNKMDLVNYQEEAFLRVVNEFKSFAKKLSLPEVRFIPASSLYGENIVKKSSVMEWYSGKSLLDTLDEIYIASDINLVDFRYAVQYVIKSNNHKRLYAGKILSGSIKKGDKIVVLPAKVESSVEEIIKRERDKVDIAFAPSVIKLQLKDELDISRGALLCRPQNCAEVLDSLEAMLVWLNRESELKKTKYYYFRCYSRETKCYIDNLYYQIDLSTLSRKETNTLAYNQIGRVSLQLYEPFPYDLFEHIKGTGSFILIDPDTSNTAACGVIIRRDLLRKEGQSLNVQRETLGVKLEERIKKIGYN
ncbi:MAG: hypothetical protein D6780_04610, partial [Candidatus Dadabacteria bacterium]